MMSFILLLILGVNCSLSASATSSLMRLVAAFDEDLRCAFSFFPAPLGIFALANTDKLTFPRCFCNHVKYFWEDFVWYATATVCEHILHEEYSMHDFSHKICPLSLISTK